MKDICRNCGGKGCEHCHNGWVGFPIKASRFPKYMTDDDIKQLLKKSDYENKSERD